MLVAQDEGGVQGVRGQQEEVASEGPAAWATAEAAEAGMGSSMRSLGTPRRTLSCPGPQIPASTLDPDTHVLWGVSGSGGFCSPSVICGLWDHLHGNMSRSPMTRVLLPRRQKWEQRVSPRIPQGPATASTPSQPPGAQQGLLESEPGGQRDTAGAIRLHRAPAAGRGHAGSKGLHTRHSWSAEQSWALRAEPHEPGVQSGSSKWSNHRKDCQADWLSCRKDNVRGSLHGTRGAKSSEVLMSWDWGS